MNKYKELLRNHYEHLHRVPEINDDLPKTKNYIMEVLKGLNCYIKECLESGLVAYFDKGAKETIAFRTDMDGLPIKEAESKNLKSEIYGQMHACGHDGHMAIALCLAQWVNDNSLPYNVVIIFQPGEEGFDGGKRLCESKVLESFDIKEVYALHLWPKLGAKEVISKPGTLMAGAAKFDIDIEGKAAHGTALEEAVDALFIGGELLGVLKRRHLEFLAEKGYHDDKGNGFSINPPNKEDRTILQVCQFKAGDAYNIIPKDAFLKGTMRAYKKEFMEALEGIIEDSCNKVAKRNKAKITYNIKNPYPPLVNNEELYAKIRNVLGRGDYSYSEMKEPVMISEDFSFYGNIYPTLFFFVGTGRDEGLHTSEFSLDTKALETGLNLWIDILTNR